MEILIIGIFVASVISLDITHAFQTLISQPVFACVILGLIWGYPGIGLVIGIVFELIFLKSLPVGASSFPENSMAAMISTLITIFLTEANPQYESQYLILAIFFGFIFAYIGMKITGYHRKWNEHFLTTIKRTEAQKDITSKDFIKWMAISMGHFVLLMYVTGLLFALGVTQFISLIPDQLLNSVPGIPAIYWIIVFSFLGALLLLPVYFRREIK